MGDYDWVIWLGLAVVLGIVEVTTLSLVFLMLAAGALTGAAVALLGVPLGLQVVVALVVALAMLGVVRPVALRHLRIPASTRTGVAALVGSQGVALERIDARSGQVKLSPEQGGGHTRTVAAGHRGEQGGPGRHAPQATSASRRSKRTARGVVTPCAAALLRRPAAVITETLARPSRRMLRDHRGSRAIGTRGGRRWHRVRQLAPPPQPRSRPLLLTPPPLPRPGPCCSHHPLKPRGRCPHGVPRIPSAPLGRDHGTPIGSSRADPP